MFGDIYSVWNFLIKPFRNVVENIDASHPGLVISKTTLRESFTVCPGTSQKRKRKNCITIPKGQVNELRKTTYFLLRLKFPLPRKYLMNPNMAKPLGRLPESYLDELDHILFSPKT